MVREFRRSLDLPELSDDNDEFSEEDNEDSRMSSNSKSKASKSNGLKNPKLSKFSKKITKDSAKLELTPSKPYVSDDDSDAQIKVDSEREDYGTFDLDRVDVVDGHAMRDDNNEDIKYMVKPNKISRMMFKVKWVQRNDGTQPLDTWYTLDDVKLHCADKLVLYYDRFVKFS